MGERATVEEIVAALSGAEASDFVAWLRDFGETDEVVSIRDNHDDTFDVTYTYQGDTFHENVSVSVFARWLDVRGIPYG